MEIGECNFKSKIKAKCFYLEIGQFDDFQRWKSMTRYMMTIQTMGTAKEVMKKIR